MSWNFYDKINFNYYEFASEINAVFKIGLFIGLSGNCCKVHYTLCRWCKTFACCILQNRRRLLIFIWALFFLRVSSAKPCDLIQFFFLFLCCECVLEVEHDAWDIARREKELSNRVAFREEIFIYIFFNMDKKFIQPHASTAV